jgi:hypothetical protein
MTFKINLGRLASLLIVFVLLFWTSSVLYAANDAGAIANIPGFLQENWAVVALVISEVAALLPSKVSGILHAVVKIAGLFFKKKSS